MEAIGKLNTISSGWDVNNRNINIKIRQLGSTGKVKEASKLFDEMSQLDPVSYASMITVFLKNHDLPKAEALFRAMPESQINIVAETAMIDGYVKLAELMKRERHLMKWRRGRILMDQFDFWVF